MNEFPIQLLIGSKGEKICRRFVSLQTRLPSIFPLEFFHKIGHYLLSCPIPFLENHSEMILSRLFFVWYRLSQKMYKNCEDLSIPQIATKCLFFDKDTFGIAIILTALKEDESFNKKHILMGINNLIPGVRLVPDSYVYVSDQNQSMHEFYLEIKKLKGGFFSSDEKKKLENELVYELQQRIEKPPSLILTENVEDLFKNIQHLSDEIKHVHELPQVMISCIEYSHRVLKFLIVAVRVIHPLTPALSSLRTHLPSLIHFSLEKTLYMGKLRNKHPKEATVFTLELHNAAFLRENNELNLREARLYIAKALENMLGPFRDFTGGLLSKENEQLSAIRALLERSNLTLSRPFVDLFYGIKPITMRVLISPRTGIHLSSLLDKLLTQPLTSENGYCLESELGEDAHVIMIKTKRKEWRVSLSQRILTYSNQTAYSYLEYEGHVYLCFFQEYKGGVTLLELIQKELKSYCKKFCTPPNQILRLNFQGGDPTSLNPRLAWNLRCHMLSSLLFEGLTRILASGKTAPAAAEKIEISPDGLHYTFHIRHAHWSNGEELTAYHFEKAWKRAIVENTIIYIKPDFFYPIKNVAKVKNGLLPIDQIGIKVPDAKTLCVELETPCPYFLNVVATPQYFPLLGDSEEPNQFNGLFVLAEWERDHHLYLSQNPYYWNAAGVKLGGIMISMVDNPSVFYQMFLNGELDIVGDPVSPLLPEVMASPEVEAQRVMQDVSRVFWVHCNTQSHPLSNLHLRKALHLSLNRVKITENVFVRQTPHMSPLPMKYASIKGNLEGDVEAARRHLQKAFEELNLDINTLPPIVFTHSNLSFELALAEELRTQWKEALGITIITHPLSWNEFSAALDQKNFQLAGIFRRDLLSNPVSHLSFFTKLHNRYPIWENAEFDKLFASSHTKDTLQRMEQILVEEVPVIPLVNQLGVSLISKRIRGMRWEENGCFNLEEAYIYENNNDIDSSSFVYHTAYLESSARAERNK